MDTSLTQSVNNLETFNACQYRIYKLDFCSDNFHIFPFSQSGKGEVDAHRFMSKHSSDHYVLFCHDPLSHFVMDASSWMKLMHTRTDFKSHFRSCFFLADNMEIFVLVTPHDLTLL